MEKRARDSMALLIQFLAFPGVPAVALGRAAANRP